MDITEEEKQRLRTEAARLLGSVRSEKKTANCRAIAHLGGKPKGTPMSEETKAKIGAANRRRWEERKQQAQEQAQEGGV
jgi:hypothetical protein